jgi:hypothetical protein
MTASARIRLRRWLRSSSAYDVLDGAVLGCLTRNEVLELADDFGVTYSECARAIREALEGGN